MAVNYLKYSRRKWRERGYWYWTLEHVTRTGGFVRRHDMFGFIDAVAIKVGEVVYLQVTSRSNMSARANKIARDTAGKGRYARPCIAIAKRLLSVFGNRIVVEGWDQPGGKGTEYRDKELEITPAELDRRANND